MRIRDKDEKDTQWAGMSLLEFLQPEVNFGRDQASIETKIAKLYDVQAKLIEKLHEKGILSFADVVDVADRNTYNNRWAPVTTTED